MHRVDILLATASPADLAPFSGGGVSAAFHQWRDGEAPPRFAGALWAFVDWTAPDMSGLEICRRLRCDPRTAAARITMVLDEDDPDVRRRALRAGADDYMPGPLNRSAVLDRVLAARPADPDQAAARGIAFGDLTIDLASFQARCQDRPVPLMPNEFRLLRYLVENPGRVFTRSQLIAAVGKQDPPVDERTVDVWIGRLRRALRAAGAADPVRTVRSLGYVMNRPQPSETSKNASVATNGACEEW